MKKERKSKLSLAFDISGVTLIVVAIVIVKLGNQPLVEILAGVLATLGFGLIAGAKYVWNNGTSMDIGIRSNYTTYGFKKESIILFSISTI